MTAHDPRPPMLDMQRALHVRAFMALFDAALTAGHRAPDQLVAQLDLCDLMAVTMDDDGVTLDMLGIRSRTPTVAGQHLTARALRDWRAAAADRLASGVRA